MKEILKRVSPCLRGIGFKGTGQNYYRASDGITSIVNFQKSTGSDRFYINLGVQPAILLNDESVPKKLKEYECMFRQRIDAPNNGQGWPTNMPSEVIELLKDKIKLLDQDYFNHFIALKERIESSDLEELLPKNGVVTLYGTYHPATLKEFSVLCKAYGLNEKSIELANLGLEICKPTAKSLIANLKQLASHNV